jgi:HD superfamily phosphohydrolase
MELHDTIFGRVEVEDRVLVELIGCGPVQRLKGVSQSGPSPFFMEDKPRVSRFDHSLGVMLLLRRHGASVEEQIAGLLHDVPHTAFSHVADFVFENESHEYHERFMDEIVYDSDIPRILKRHGFEVDRILDEDNFGLLERDLPRLCADRLDYSMRDIKLHEIASVEKFKESLTTFEGEFVFEDFETAEDYGLRYVQLDAEVYASPKEVAIYELFAEILRTLLEEGELREEELFKTDEYVMEKVRSSNIEKVEKLLSLLDGGIDVRTGVRDPDFIGETKARAVDPYFIENGEKVKASNRSDKLEEKITSHRENINSGLNIGVKGLDKKLLSN